MNCSLRSSRVTGPKYALQSVLCYYLTILLHCRQNEALNRLGGERLFGTHNHCIHHIAFLTRPRGIASFTVTLMMSPTDA